MINSESYIKDLERQIGRINLSDFKDKKVLVTGAAGLICSYIVDMFILANKKYDANITIMALSRTEESLKSRFDYYFDNELFIPVIQDVCSPCEVDVDYIIHGASNANPKLYIEDPVGTMNANYLGTLNLLELAKRSNAKMVFISSGDVYGSFENPDVLLEENEYGYVDILNIRSSYASSKRASETLCASFASQYGVMAKIVRPAHIYGPTFTKGDTRAVSDFMGKATKGENIIMKSDGSSLRSYCYVGDTVVGILKVLVDGEVGNAYNITNTNGLVSIRELAETICKYAGVELVIELPSNELDKKINQNVKVIKLSSKKLEDLGWEVLTSVDEGVELTLKVISEIK